MSQNLSVFAPVKSIFEHEDDNGVSGIILAGERKITLPLYPPHIRHRLEII
jgi:hypothetical protein